MAVEQRKCCNVFRVLTNSRRLHECRKDVPFLRNGSTVFNKTVMASMGTVNLGWAVLTNIVPLYFL